MSDELPVNVHVILFCGQSKCRNIDGHMNDTEERQCEHSRYGPKKSGPINNGKIYGESA